MPVRRTGDWAGVTRLIGGLSKDLKDARRISLMRFAAKAEREAKMHMSLQDLPWEPLKAETLAAKARKGQSNLILMATSDYFQAITSWVDTDTAYAGVKKDVTDDEGEEIVNIAAVLEFGSDAAGIPARPLWQPVFEDTMKHWAEHDRPDMIFAAKMVKRR